jgi:hypothetical protein
MIASTVEELTPLIGTAQADAGQGTDGTGARGGGRGAALRAGSSTSPRRRPGRRCWTRAPTCARPGRCSGSSPPRTAGSGSDATS